MKTFTELTDHLQTDPVSAADDITESRGLLRKGAAVAFTAQSRTHAKNAQASLQQSLTTLQSIQSKTTDEKIDAVSTALQSISTALIEITKQLNQTTAVSASSALLNERTDKEILNLLKQARTSRRRR